MRLARDLGTVRDLYPDGIKEVADLPHTLFNAIRLALSFLGFEELPAEEQPPKSIWLNTEKLSAWFETVKKRRDEKYGGDTKSIDDPVQNDAASALISS